MEIDNSFYIDRTQGFCIVFPVKQGIVQPFDDHEYHGHLSGKTVGKHISELQKICTNQLYKTWIKHFKIANSYAETKYSNLKFEIYNTKKRIAELNKTTIVINDKNNDYYRYESISFFENRKKEHQLNKFQSENLLVQLEEKLKQAQTKIDSVKLKVFNEHGIQL